MLKINTEYRKGILFIRLKGRYDNNYFLTTINYLINNFGINIIALNLSELDYISLENIKDINNKIINILKKKKKILIIDKEIRNNLFNNTIKINNEIDAFSLI